MKKKKKKKSIKSMFMCLMLICWFLPLLLIAGINIYYLTSDRFETKISKEIEQLKFNDENSIEHVKQLVEESREATYDGVLTDLYEEYKQGWITKEVLVSRDINYLRDHYSRNEDIEMAMFWYKEDPAEMVSSTYNTGLGATYSAVKTYWEEDHRDVTKLARDLDTRVAFYVNDDRLYLIRNIYTPSYENLGPLIFRINTDHCFRNYRSFPTGTSVTLYLDNQPIQLLGESVSKKETGMLKMGGNSGYTWRNGKLRLYHETVYEEHKLTVLVRFDDTTNFFLFYGYRTVIWAMLLCLLPLILIFLHVFERSVTKPIGKMMDGAEHIEQGQLGYKLDFLPESSEFQYLADSFNDMSDRLKYQFDHIYEEELALRDARIKALQSHINPHFMNNTLEIINWEARLSGNEKVSKMIEALGTLMNAAMDRKKQREIPLSEEMVSVNAYLYIISERLGQRIQIFNELPDEIMDYMVPRLILQPVIENAVEHGVVKTGKGTVSLQGFQKGKFLYLEITNDGVLTEEDKARVKRLLDVEQDSSNESSLNLGISNVNQRLKILYGEECGLTIEETETGHVRARLKILIEK